MVPELLSGFWRLIEKRGDNEQWLYGLMAYVVGRGRIMYRRLCQTAIIAVAFQYFMIPSIRAGQIGSTTLHAYQADVHAWRVARDSLGRAVDFARTRTELFNLVDTRPPTLMRRGDKLAIWNTWSAVLDSQAMLERLKHKYSRFRQWPEEKRGVAFALDHAAFLAAYRYALEWIAVNPATPPGNPRDAA